MHDEKHHKSGNETKNKTLFWFIVLGVGLPLIFSLCAQTFEDARDFGEVMFSTGTVITLFLMTLVLSHFILHFCGNLSKKQWKQFDYIWLGVAAIGLLAIGNELESYTHQDDLWILKQDRSSRIKYMESITAEYKNQLCEDRDRLTIVVTKLKSDLETIDSERLREDKIFKLELATSHLESKQEICNGVEELNALIKMHIKDDHEALKTLNIRPSSTGVMEAYKYVNLSESVEKYNKDGEKLKNLEYKLSPSILDQFLAHFMPLIFSIVLAFRFTKVTGEARYENK